VWEGQSFILREKSLICIFSWGILQCFLILYTRTEQNALYWICHTSLRFSNIIHEKLDDTEKISIAPCTRLTPLLVDKSKRGLNRKGNYAQPISETHFDCSRGHIPWFLSSSLEMGQDRWQYGLVRGNLLVSTSKSISFNDDKGSSARRTRSSRWRRRDGA